MAALMFLFFPSLWLDLVTAGQSLLCSYMVFFHEEAKTIRAKSIVISCWILCFRRVPNYGFFGFVNAKSYPKNKAWDWETTFSPTGKTKKSTFLYFFLEKPTVLKTVSARKTVS